MYSDPCEGLVLVVLRGFLSTEGIIGTDDVYRSITVPRVVCPSASCVTRLVYSTLSYIVGGHSQQRTGQRPEPFPCCNSWRSLGNLVWFGVRMGCIVEFQSSKSSVLKTWTWICLQSSGSTLELYLGGHSSAPPGSLPVCLTYYNICIGMLMTKVSLAVITESQVGVPSCSFSCSQSAARNLNFSKY